MTTNGTSTESSIAFSIGNAPELLERARHEIAATIAAKTTLDADRLTADLAQRDIHAEFTREFGALALKVDYLPDVVAAYLATMWSVVHDCPLPSLATVRDLSQRFVALLAFNPLVADAANRQLMGNALVYEALLTREAHKSAQANRDAGLLAQMAASARANIRQRFGIDLTKKDSLRANLHPRRQ